MHRQALARAWLRWNFTAPWLMPMAAATSATERVFDVEQQAHGDGALTGGQLLHEVEEVHIVDHSVAGELSCEACGNSRRRRR